LRRLIPFILVAVPLLSAQRYTRGVGLYPGDPKDYNGPTMVMDNSTYATLPFIGRRISRVLTITTSAHSEYRWDS
jgi:hypothetical protein